MTFQPHSNTIQQSSNNLQQELYGRDGNKHRHIIDSKVFLKMLKFLFQAGFKTINFRCRFTYFIIDNLKQKNADASNVFGKRYVKMKF